MSIKTLIQEFSSLYGEPKSELNYNSPFELLIAVMLSAQSTDKKVNEVTPVLFSKYKNAKELSKAKVSEIEKIIREVNYYKTKSKHVVETSKIIHEKYKDKLPKTHEELIELPGVGNKTANVILSELGFGYAFPVDTHVFRVAKRIGLASSTTRDKVEEELCHVFKKEDWHHMHHWLIYHGRRVCNARNPSCDTCRISKICKRIGVSSSDPS